MKTNSFITTCLLLLCIALLTVFVTTGCNRNTQAMEPSFSKKENRPMRNLLVGRFAITVPETMKLEVQTSSIRMTEINEVLWPHDVSHEVARENVWKARLGEIAQREPPLSKKKTVIETRSFSDFGTWARGIFYHGDNISASEAQWDVLIDAGKGGVWLKSEAILIEPTNVEKAVRNLRNLSKAYRWRDPMTRSTSADDSFYLENGLIALPYKWQEGTYARFSGDPLELKLEIEMQETQEVEKVGLVERYGAAISTGYALGVEVDKIRGQKRTLAGLQGEDVIVRMKDKDGAVLNFAWEYPGQEDSGERPEIQITMESPDGALEEKIKVWDAILDSFKPMYPIRK